MKRLDIEADLACPLEDAIQAATLLNQWASESVAAPLDGRAVVTVTIPADATAGAHTLTVTTDAGTVVTIPVTVG